MGECFSWPNWWRFTAAVATRGQRGGLREAVLRAAVGVVAEAGWRIDHPAPLPERVVIVVGHQRSGTTWLHRLFAPLDPWHRIRFREPEEDEFALWAIFRSPMNALDRPWPAEGAPAIDGDEAALRYYAQVVARAVRRSGARYVGKNPHFTHRMNALRRCLPGVRFVQLVRHPREAIASRLSLLGAIWRRRVPGFSELAPHQVETIYRSSVRCYLGGDGQADLDVPYAELVADPVGTVRSIHRRLDLDPPGPRLLELVAGSTREPSAPRETLERFGLARERLAEDLAPVYSRWGFAA